MNRKTKYLLKEILVRKNQFIQRHISERSRFALRFFFSLPRSLQLWITKKSLKNAWKKKREEMGLF